MHCIVAKLANCFAKTLRGFADHTAVEQLIEQRCALTLWRLPENCGSPCAPWAVK